MNEELQSANEELETSKEELQSINEELQTVNAELSARVEELSRANSDIANLLESTQIATVFLDRGLTIKSFTPAAKDLFRLVESDTGRPINHVRARFYSDTVQEDAERVMRTLGTMERQIEGTDNDQRYIMRMVPYRTVDNVIGGVVITFVDITRLTAAETRIGELTADLRDRLHDLETLLDLVPVGILLIQDAPGGLVRVNRHGVRLLGEEANKGGAGLRPIKAALRIFQGDRELAENEHPLQLAVQSGQSVPGLECQLLRSDGQRVDVMLSATPLFDEKGQASGAIAALLDISERRAAEAHQQILLHELQHRVKNIITTIGALASRMMKDSATLEEFAPAFLGRLRAMAATHELLSHGNWTGASLSALIGSALQAHLGKDGTAVTLGGPDLTLTPAAASTLGMVFYELATNATKYGSLSQDGRVGVTWRVEREAAGDAVMVDWTEIDGPPVEGPIEEGFGTGFVKRSIEYELGGTASLQPGVAGLRWTISFPLQRNVQPRAGQ
jgi:two-component system CheB/CheR fusion protein